MTLVRSAEEDHDECTWSELEDIFYPPHLEINLPVSQSGHRLLVVSQSGQRSLRPSAEDNVPLRFSEEENGAFRCTAASSVSLQAGHLEVNLGTLGT